jgi:tetratricopeptide (TPR) repeat protein
MLILPMSTHSTLPPTRTITTIHVRRKSNLRNWTITTIAACCICIAGCEPHSPEPAPVPALSGELIEHYNLILAGEYGPARVRLRQLIDAGTGDSRAMFLMGLAHHRERSYPKAAAWFEQAIATHPPYPPAAHFLGWAWYHAGDAGKSKAAFTRHLTLDPTEGDTHFGLGVLALERGDVEQAEAYFQDAIALQRDRPNRQSGVAKAMARQAQLLEQRGDLNAAVSLLAESIAIDPSLYEAQFTQARLLRRLGRLDEAAAAENAAVAARSRVETTDTRPR